MFSAILEIFYLYHIHSFIIKFVFLPTPTVKWPLCVRLCRYTHPSDPDAGPDPDIVLLKVEWGVVGEGGGAILARGPLRPPVDVGQGTGVTSENDLHHFELPLEGSHEHHFSWSHIVWLKHHYCNCLYKFYWDTWTQMISDTCISVCSALFSVQSKACYQFIWPYYHSTKQEGICDKG